MPKKGQFSICTIDSCSERMLARGFCRTHYSQHRRAGLIQPLPKIPVPDRFWAKVDKNGPIPAHKPELGQCWVWMPKPQKSGYGSFGVPGRSIGYAHRYSYELNIGPIPDGLHIDHVCRNRICVRPAHLEAVTQQENNRRAAQAVTHCPAGHAYEGYNLYIDRRGTRRCRRCANDGFATKRNAKVIRVRFHGHFPERDTDGVWRCRCGRPLGQTRRESMALMRDVHVPELRAALRPPQLVSA